jgi:hypothetical protein
MELKIIVSTNNEPLIKKVTIVLSHEGRAVV